MAINALSYAVGNGTDDDTTALTTAANAALAAGQSLYFPAATYKVVNWAPPAGTSSNRLRMYGEGKTSHIKGCVRWRSYQDYTNLMIGDKTTSALKPYYSSGPATDAHVTFNYLTLRGGGAGDSSATANATVLHPAQGYGSQSIDCHDLVFDHCIWECNYIENWTYPYSQMAQDVSWAVDRGTGDTSYDIHFNYCHFGVENEQSRTGGLYGGIVFWSSSAESYDTYPDKSSGYYDEIYFDRCIFEQSDIWNLDMSGAQYCPRSFTENTVYLTNNVFKGGSGAYHSEVSSFRVTAQIEPGFDSTITGNIFGIGDTNGFKVIKDSSRNTISGNIFDYRTYAEQEDVQSGGYMIDSIYLPSGIIRADTASYPNVYTNNELQLPTGKYTSIGTNGWLYNVVNSTVSNNTVTRGAAGAGPLADVADLVYLPIGWTLDTEVTPPTPPAVTISGSGAVKTSAVAGAGNGTGTEGAGAIAITGSGALRAGAVSVNTEAPATVPIVGDGSVSISPAAFDGTTEVVVGITGTGAVQIAAGAFWTAAVAGPPATHHDSVYHTRRRPLINPHSRFRNSGG